MIYIYIYSESNSTFLLTSVGEYFRGESVANEFATEQERGETEIQSEQDKSCLKSVISGSAARRMSRGL